VSRIHCWGVWGRAVRARRGALIHGAVEPRAGHDRAGDLLIQYDLSNGGVNPSIKQVVANDRQKLRFTRFQTGGTWYVD
jgi:hypothetical protein